MPCALFQRINFGVYRRVSVKEVIIFQKVRFKGHNLLHSHGPLLIPRAGKAECFVPCRKLNRPRARIFGQGDSQHFNEDAIHIVFGLLFSKSQGIHLNPVAKAAIFRIAHTITGFADFVPKIDESAHFAHFSDKPDASIHKKRYPPHKFREIFLRDLTAQFVQHGGGCGKRKGKFLFRGRSGLLQVVGADIHRVPLWNMLITIFRNIGDEF